MFMTQDEIIEMARQAGLLVIGTADGGEAVYTWPAGITEEIETFTKLVDAKATAREREACAKVCEYYAGTFNAHRIGECADAIRARGNKE